MAHAVRLCYTLTAEEIGRTPDDPVNAENISQNVSFRSATGKENMAPIACLCKRLLVVGIACGPFFAYADDVDVSPAVQHDHLPSLRGVMPKPEDLSNGKHVRQVKHIPHLNAPGNTPDASVQGLPSTSLAALLTPALGFAGVGNGDYGFAPDAAPPDTNGAAGATQYVQWVNESFAVFDKATGTLLYGPAAGNSIWSGFGGGCQTNNDGDPIVQYDKAANRWIFTQFSVSTTPYLQCVAVSTTSDVTGTYNRYSFSYSKFPDYPKLGVWPDAYYITFNMFQGNFFAGSAL